MSLERFAILLEPSAKPLERLANSLEHSAILLECLAMPLESSAMLLECCAMLLERSANYLEYFKSDCYNWKKSFYFPFSYSVYFSEVFNAFLAAVTALLTPCLVFFSISVKV